MWGIEKASRFRPLMELKPNICAQHATTHHGVVERIGVEAPDLRPHVVLQGGALLLSVVIVLVGTSAMRNVSC